MADKLDQATDALRKSLIQIENLKRQNEMLSARASEPVAILGIGCRLPGGVSSPEQLWRLVVDGVDAVGPFPTDRGWDPDVYHPEPGHLGKTYTRDGGFLSDAAGFDADFFGISPREAVMMDPQQRLLLETAWEALERARIKPASLAGSPTGVFMGVMYEDYAPRMAGREGYISTGTASSVASGRISFVLGLEGPAITVDTACSSSLVALHLAGQSLRHGECDLALAGGATVMATPEIFTEFSRLRAIAPDGRSKSFGAAADGTGWAEGAGVLVLERLSDAQRHNHPILGVIRGSAVNQDGASNGLTAPNGPSQQRVIRQTLANAGLTSTDIDLVEAHGTGTPLGDPIEAQALFATYGKDRPTDQPLWLGSIKSNIGHAQAAAGVSGVIKLALAIDHGVMPKTLHCQQPSPHIDWRSDTIKLLDHTQPWPTTDHPRRGAVSSFGISGTNAHLILEQPPAQPGQVGRDQSDAIVPWVISARSRDALAAQARRLAAFVGDRPELDPVDVAYSLATTRSALEHRAAVVGRDREELLRALDDVVHAVPGTLRDLVTDGSTAFLFAGQGSHRPGMGRELYETFPAFASAFDDACRELDELLDRPLRDVAFAVKDSPEATLLDQTAYTQAGLFAFETALYRLLESWGIRPDYVAGHSIGEIAAAHVAGVLSLSDACALVAARGRLMQALPARGGMIALQASEDEVRPLIGAEPTVGIAAVNGPDAVVISGEAEAVGRIADDFRERGRRIHRLAVSHAFHSPLMEPMLDEFRGVVEGLTFDQPRIPVVSGLTGALAEQELGSAQYWVQHAREAVRFADAVSTLRMQGVARFVEIGPDTTLTTLAGAFLDDDARVVPTSRKNRPEVAALVEAVATMHVGGQSIDWERFFAETGAVVTDLPTYAFTPKRYWLEAGSPTDVTSAGLAAAEHPLLSAALAFPEGDGLVFTGRLSLREQTWLADHMVYGTVLAPGTLLLELALYAAEQVDCAIVEELTIQAPLLLPESSPVAVHVRVGSVDESGRRSIVIYSRPTDAEHEWTRHAEGTVRSGTITPDLVDAAWPPDNAVPVDLDDAYERIADAGYEYGPLFQGLRKMWRREGELFTEARLPDSDHLVPQEFRIHPALLDASLHGFVLDAIAELGQTLLPFVWRDVQLDRPGAAELRVRLSRQGSTLSASITDGASRPVATITGLDTRPVTAEQLHKAVSGSENSLFGVDWLPVPNASGAAANIDELSWALHRDPAELVAAMTAQTPIPAVVCVTLNSHDDADAPDVAAAAHNLTQQVLCLVQEWLADNRFESTRLVFLTRAAIAATPDDSVVDLPAAAAAGLIRATQAEHPDRFLLVDLDVDLPDVQTLTAALASGETQLALRNGALLVPRLVRLRTRPLADAEPVSSPSDLDSARTVLITGATGTLGTLIARHLVTEHNVRHLLLTSRRGPASAGAAELVAGLAELGAEATIVACDMADRSQVESLLSSIPAKRPLTAVIHAAGVLDDGIVGTLTPDRLDAVLAPKVDGAWHLHQLTKDWDLQAFVVFSSAVATFGAAGQSSYIAANSFLDALAAHRRANGLTGVSLAWGLWAQRSGMVEQRSDDELDQMQRALEARTGMVPLATRESLTLLDAAWGSDRPLVAPVRLNLGGLRRSATTIPTVLRGLVPTPPRRGAQKSLAETNDLAERLKTLSESDAKQLLQSMVIDTVAAVLGYSNTDEVEPTKAFQNLGLDSLTAVELRNQLSDITGLRLPTTLIFDFPTPTELVDKLRGDLLGDNGTSIEPALPRAALAAGADDEPVAIVGIGCRLPGGVSSPEQLWRLVVEGVDAVGPFPTDRGWDPDVYHPEPGHLGKTYTRDGGFLSDAARFDADFFGISPREAVMMDPQQRLLLETAWEALERARIKPASLAGSPTGVFMGVMYEDYALRMAGREGYISTGTGSSVASGRISFVLGLEGPAITVDTACSSSLVALHLASQSLRHGECDLALAGGATVMATPEIFTEFSRLRAIAPDGRSKSFGAGADGMGWAEGVGVLVLERLSDAQRHNHPILGVIRGSAVNQDGASNGLTAPNGPSQQRVIRQTLANAGLTSTDVDLVEAHGTGTPLGDPIEAQALFATYGKDRPTDQPLWLGSIKSNIGHAQAAAGVSGVIKLALAVDHGVMPKTLHCEQPSPNIDWESDTVKLLDHTQPWPTTDHPRRGAVSSFGIGGTNAHLIVEQSPIANADNGDGDATVIAAGGRDPGVSGSPLMVWTLSGHTATALGEQAGRLLEHVTADPDIDPIDLAYSLATTRTHHAHRAAIAATGDDHVAILTGALSALAKNQSHPALVQDTALQSGSKIVFVFPGQGAQYPGMGRQLYEHHPAFADTLDECDHVMRSITGWSILDVLRQEPQAPSLERVDVVQPVLFAIMVSLAAMWRAHGIVPDAVIGHSQGEIAAAHVAGALTLADAAKAVALRSRALTELAGSGGMASILLGDEPLQQLMQPYNGLISIAATNGPNYTVLSGDSNALQELVATCDQRDIRARMIQVDYPSHSGQVERIRDRLIDELADLDPRPAEIAFYSTVDGESRTGPLDTTTLAADYWYRNLRGAVRFGDGVAHLLGLGDHTFVELSPHPVLSPAIAETISVVGSGRVDGVGDRAGSGSVVIPTLRRDHPDIGAVSVAMARLHCHGCTPVWSTLWPAATAITLPTYAFQRKSYWLHPTPVTDDISAGTLAEGRFWKAVEDNNIETIADTLRIDDENGRSALEPVVKAMGAWHRRQQLHATVDDWRYQVRWRPVTDTTKTHLTGEWLILVPAALAEPAVVEALSIGEDAAVHSIVVDPAESDRVSLTKLLATETAGMHLDGIVSLLALDERPHLHQPGISTGLAATLTLVQALVDCELSTRLWLVTRGAVGTGNSESAPNPQQAGIWGLGQSIGLEYPQRWGGLIDLPAVADSQTWTHLRTALTSPQAEDQMAIRASGIYARRLVGAPPAGESTRPWRPSGTAVITGGTGGLGRHVARWLADSGADHLVLVSRSGPEAPGAAELVAELEALGTTATLAACDAADRGALADLLDRVRTEHGPIRAVVHAAGVGKWQSVVETTLDQLSEQYTKAISAQYLDELLSDDPLEAFVLFSSGAAIWGGSRQAAYAAANASLDALAQYRRANGRVATSVAWGLWDGQGMGSDPEVSTQLRRIGLSAMPAEVAITALQQALDTNQTCITIADVDWNRFIPIFTAQRPHQLLQELRKVEPPQDNTGHQTPGNDESSLQQRLANLTPDQQHRAIYELVIGATATVLGHDNPDHIPPDQTFKALGIDSLTALELRNNLTQTTNQPLPTTLAFDHPTPTALTNHLTNLVTRVTTPTAETIVTEVGPITALLREVLERDQFRLAAEILTVVSAIRDPFITAEGNGNDLASRELAAESTVLPILVCVSRLTDSYRQIANAANCSFNLTEITMPGFDGTALPRSIGEAAVALAETVKTEYPTDRIVMVGDSISCSLAVRTADVLRSMDFSVVGVVLVDPLEHPDNPSDADVEATLSDIDPRNVATTIDDRYFIATGHYFKLLGQDGHYSSSLPQVVIRPRRGDRKRSATLLKSEAPLTALKITNWLADLGIG